MFLILKNATDSMVEDFTEFLIDFKLSSDLVNILTSTKNNFKLLET